MNSLNGEKSSSVPTMKRLSTVHSAWWPLPSGGGAIHRVPQQQRVDGGVVGVAQEHRVRRVGHVEEHPAAVPVRQEHDPCAVDLLHDDVVEERFGEEQLGLVDVEVVGIDLGDQHRVLGIGDVEDVDVGRLHLVLRDEVGVLARGPHEHAVGLVRVVGEFAPPVRREVTEVLGELLRVRWVRDIPQAEAGLVVLAAALLVDGEDVAGELVGLDVETCIPSPGRVSWLIGMKATSTGLSRSLMSTTQTPASDACGRLTLARYASSPGSRGAPVGQVCEIAVWVDGHVGDKFRAGAADLHLPMKSIFPISPVPSRWPSWAPC